MGGAGGKDESQLEKKPTICDQTDVKTENDVTLNVKAEPENVEVNSKPKPKKKPRPKGFNAPYKRAKKYVNYKRKRWCNFCWIKFSKDSEYYEHRKVYHADE